MTAPLEPARRPDLTDLGVSDGTPVTPRSEYFIPVVVERTGARGFVPWSGSGRLAVWE